MKTDKGSRIQPQKKRKTWTIEPAEDARQLAEHYLRDEIKKRGALTKLVNEAVRHYLPKGLMKYYAGLAEEYSAKAEALAREINSLNGGHQTEHRMREGLDDEDKGDATP